jgi:hypothetical protein
VILAHLADLHLGFRQYHRQTPAGLNQREADVAHAFRTAIDQIVAAKPDIVLVAGDLFHSVRPTNPAILFAFRQFQRLREALPDAPLVIIAGNHDSPRSVETGSILGLFATLGATVVADEQKRLSFPDLDLSVLAVPHIAVAAGERNFRPEGNETNQVLLLHGPIPGLYPWERHAPEYGGSLVTTEDLTRGDWSYVALGHYHVQREVAPRVWYSGALDYVSPNPWGELADEQNYSVPGRAGRVSCHGAVTWQAIARPESARPAPARRHRRTAAELDTMLATAMGGIRGGHADQIIRQVIRNVPGISAELKHTAIRLKARGAALSPRSPPAGGAPRDRGGFPGEAADPPRAGRVLSEEPGPATRRRPGSVRAHRRGADGSDREGVVGELMQLERLRLVNFRQHEDTELVLGAGLTGIIGPNGAGKTTLLEGGLKARRTDVTRAPMMIRRQRQRGPRCGSSSTCARRAPLQGGPLAERRRADGPRRSDRQQSGASPIRWAGSGMTRDEFFFITSPPVAWPGWRQAA